MDNPKKLVAQDTQDTTETQHNMRWTPLCENEHNRFKIKHEPSYKDVEVETKRTLFYAKIVTDIITLNSERKDTQNWCSLY